MNRSRMLLLALVVLASGCSKDDQAAEAAESTPSAPAAARPAAEAPANAGEGPAVALLEPGAEPRTELRFTPTEGDSVDLEMVMRMSMRMSLAGSPLQSIDIPPIAMHVELECTKVSGDTSRWEMKYVDTEVRSDPSTPPQVVAAMQQAMSELDGFSGHVVIDARGFVKEADFAVPPGANPQLAQMIDGIQQSLDQLTAPLPAEPIGVGGKWQVEQRIDQQGMVLKQKLVYTVTSIEDGVVEAKVALTQSADRQKMQPPGMPPGVSAELLSLESSGSGETRIDLSKAMPVGGTIAANMEMKSRIEAQGQSQNMDMTMGMQIDISAK